MNLFLFKIYITRGYSPFCVLHVRLCAFVFIIISEVQTGGRGGEESKGTNMEMKSSMVKVKTKTSQSVSSFQFYSFAVSATRHPPASAVVNGHG